MRSVRGSRSFAAPAADVPGFFLRSRYLGQDDLRWRRLGLGLLECADEARTFGRVDVYGSCEQGAVAVGGETEGSQLGDCHWHADWSCKDRTQT